MKFRALGTAPAQPVTFAPSEPKPTAPPTLFAAVSSRGPDGLPTALALPAPLAGATATLSVGGIWAADVRPDGTLETDGDRKDLLAKLTPGVRLVASATAAGIVAVVAVTARPGQ